MSDVVTGPVSDEHEPDDREPPGRASGPSPLGRLRGAPETGGDRALRVGLGLLAGTALWFVLGATLPRGMPTGIVALGLVFGSLYALNAVGLVLVYRANRVVNFAQAEFGSVAAVLAIVFVVHWRWNIFLAIGCGLLLAAVLGAVIEMLVIRRFKRAPRLILAVATIALAQILAGLAMIIPLQFDGSGRGTFELPFDGTFTLDPAIFKVDHLAAVVIVPLVLGALAAFLRFTSYGTGIRAAAENGDRASLLGIPVTMLSTVVWSVAATLSALAVLLRVPVVGFNSFSSVSGGGPTLLLFTLAAAVIGRMESFPVTAAAALALGVFQEIVFWNWSNATLVDALLIVIILGALLIQRDVFSRAAETGIATWKAVREVRPVPTELRRLPEVRFGFGGLRLLLLAVAVSVPHVAKPSEIGAASLMLIYAIVAVSLFVLTGWGGHISLGQFALVGFGAATTTVLYGRHDWDIVLATLAGIVVAGLVALLLGLPALRLKGPFLAVTTLAFAVSSATFFLQERYVPWFIERRIEQPALFGRIELESDTQIYYLALVGLVAVIYGVKGLRASRTGRAIVAVRDNELAAEAVSLDARRLKLTAIATSGAIAGFAGAIYAIHQGGMFSDSYGPEVSLRLFSMVVIGGLGSLPGAVMGAMYIRGAEFFLPAGWDLVAGGVGILVLLLLLPEGLGGLLYDLRDRYLRRVAARRGIVVTSLAGDTGSLEGGDDGSLGTGPPGTGPPDGGTGQVAGADRAPAIAGADGEEAAVGASSSAPDRAEESEPGPAPDRVTARGESQ